MGRKANFPEALYQHNFAQYAKSEPHARTRLRFLAMTHLQEGVSQVETARALRVTKETIRQWVKRLREEGLDGLYERSGRGNKPLLKGDQEAAFKEAVLHLHEQKMGGRVKGSDVHQLLAEQFDITCHPNTVYELLKQVGLVWISSRVKHPAHDPQAQSDFKKTLHN